MKNLSDELKKTPEELNLEVSEEHCYVLNQVNRIEKVMRENGLVFDDKYLRVRQDLLKSVGKYHSYVEKECSSFDPVSVEHHSARTEKVDVDWDPFRARIELSKGASKISKYSTDVEDNISRMGVNVISSVYRERRDSVLDSFDAYRKVVDPLLRDLE